MTAAEFARRAAHRTTGSAAARTEALLRALLMRARELHLSSAHTDRVIRAATRRATAEWGASR